jgi:O-acetyl-ADP-ribose deacetylase (regulator of RNase III)
MGGMPNQIMQHVFPNGAYLLLLQGDLTQAWVDAIVNAANAQLSHGGGVAAAIVRQGGREIQQESDAWVLLHGPISHDRPALTGAGRLRCRKIIHALGPVWGEGNERQKLRAAFTASLRLANEQRFASLAFPAISTGIYAYPFPEAAVIPLEAVETFFEDQPGSSIRQVQLILFNQPAIDAFLQAFDQRWPPGTEAT